MWQKKAGLAEFLAGPGERAMPGDWSALRSLWSGSFRPTHRGLALAKEDAAHIRSTALLVTVWFLIFSLPLFAFTPDRSSTGVRKREAIRTGLAVFLNTIKRITEYKQIAHYLLARMIYTDGLNTLFAFGGIYAAGSFGFSFTEIIHFGIAINLTSGLGAVAFAWIDDWIGPKKTILIAILALIFLSTTLLIIESKTLFWIFGLALGIFVGPAQAASRSLMAHMAPEKFGRKCLGFMPSQAKRRHF